MFVFFAKAFETVLTSLFPTSKQFWKDFQFINITLCGTVIQLFLQVILVHPHHRLIIIYIVINNKDNMYKYHTFTKMNF